nr:FAD-binding oxidoreductase [Bacillota bacterium]
MRTSADVVIIGGGINGSSAAYNLAKLGVKNIIVLERDTICGGSTGRCGAGIRAQWGTLMNCQIAANAISTFEGLKDELGMDKGLNQCGYLMVASRAGASEQLR